MERFLSFFWKWWLLWQSFLLVAGFFLFWENSVWCCKCSAEWRIFLFRKAVCVGIKILEVAEDFFVLGNGVCCGKNFGEVEKVFFVLGRDDGNL